MREKKYVLLKDIVIPAGTVLEQPPSKIELCDGSHKMCSVGLSNNTCGMFIYPVEHSDDVEAMSEYFTTLK